MKIKASYVILFFIIFVVCVIWYKSVNGGMVEGFGGNVTIADAGAYDYYARRRRERDMVDDITTYPDKNAGVQNKYKDASDAIINSHANDTDADVGADMVIVNDDGNSVDQEDMQGYRDDIIAYDDASYVARGSSSISSGGLPSAYQSTCGTVDDMNVDAFANAEPDTNDGNACKMKYANDNVITDIIESLPPCKRNKKHNKCVVDDMDDETASFIRRANLGLNDMK